MTSDLVIKAVYCLRDGKVMGGPYRLSHTRTFGTPSSPPLSERLIEDASNAEFSFEGASCIAAVRGRSHFEIRDP